ncbi:MAG: hypothetical protein FWC32_04415 [Firmicutes bacterium]|nr:hypothetical protein [Bacillota bacterium]
MTINDFELYIEEMILARGRDYYSANNVTSLDYVNGTWVANVKGNEKYTVSVTLSDSNGIVYTQCDCPYDWSEHCKHKAAVFYAIRNNLNKVPAIQNMSPQNELDQPAKIVNAYKRRKNIENRIKRQFINSTDNGTMQWQKDMEKAIAYIENNLVNTIDYNIAAQHMNTSVWEF